MQQPFAEFALLLLIAAAVGALAVRLRQPVLIAYIVAGIAVGPAGFELVKSHDQIDLLAQIGVAVLLFLVGLKLDLQHVRHIGPVALATGLGQLAFTITIGFVLILAMGHDWLTSLYVAVALTFSSTIIIIKLLSDKRELDSLHGRIAVGFLIVQDIAVVLAMMAMSALRADGESEVAWLDLATSIGTRVLGRRTAGLCADALHPAKAYSPHGTLARAPAHLRHCMGYSTGRTGRMGRILTRSGGLSGRLFARLDSFSRCHRCPA